MGPNSVTAHGGVTLTCTRVSEPYIDLCKLFDMPYFLEMSELLSYLVGHISVLPAMLTPTTTESPSMC